MLTRINARSHHGGSRARAGRRRASISLVVADMVERGARVLDVGCGDGELLRLLEIRGVDGRGIELSREGVNECVAKGLAVVQGDADTDLEDYPERRLRFCHPVADPAGDAAAARRARAHAADRPPRHRVVPEFRPLADPAAAVLRRPHAAYRQSALCVVRDAQYPFLHHQGFPRSSVASPAPRWSGRSRSTPGAAAAAENAVVVLEPVRRTGGVLAEPEALDSGRRFFRQAHRQRLGARSSIVWSMSFSQNRLPLLRNMLWFRFAFRPPARRRRRGARSSMVRASGS